MQNLDIVVLFLSSWQQIMLILVFPVKSPSRNDVFWGYRPQIPSVQLKNMVFISVKLVADRSLSMDSWPSGPRMLMRPSASFTFTDRIPAQRVSNAENFSIWWHHHGNCLLFCFLYQSNIKKNCDLPYCHISCVNCCYEVVGDCRITESIIPFSSLCIIFPSKLDAWIETNRSPWNPYSGPDVDLFNGHTTYVNKYIDTLWFNSDSISWT